jgi:hypothetical protein
VPPGPSTPVPTGATGATDLILPLSAPPARLAAGLLEARLLRIELRQAPVVTAATLSASQANVGLDPDLRLRSVGLCPDVLCLLRGRASVTDSGSDGFAAWGRWIDGAARTSVAGQGGDHPQSARAGLHYLVGIPTLTMPTQGSASYQLAGATQPTFSDGSRAPGSFQGSAVVQFATGRDTRVALDGKVHFDGDTRYRFTSTGGLLNPAATNVTMTGTNSFRGTLDVQPDAPTNALGCQPNSPCRATVSGGFLGPEAARLGVGYTVTGATAGGTSISGVGVLRRNP